MRKVSHELWMGAEFRLVGDLWGAALRRVTNRHRLLLISGCAQHFFKISCETLSGRG